MIAALPALFPEDRFPCPAHLRGRYARRVRAGLGRMRASRAVLCGIARDAAGVLPAMIGRIEALGALFRDFAVVVYENDSADDTPGLLRGWGARNPAVAVDSERLGRPRWGQVRSLERAEHLAYCRNRYHERVVADFRGWDLAIVLDMDLADGFSFEGVAHSLGHDDWDMIGSYGVQFRAYGGAGRYPVFFDVWAFREVGAPGAHDESAINPRTYRRGLPLLPVWSCFGGLALYRMDAFAAGGPYEGTDCEHVPFHARMRRRGFDRLFMNPSQIVLVPPP